MQDNRGGALLDAAPTSCPLMSTGPERIESLGGIDFEPYSFGFLLIEPGNFDWCRSHARQEEAMAIVQVFSERIQAACVIPGA